MTRGFEVLKLRILDFLASWVDLREEEVFEVRELVSLFRGLAFRWGDLLPGGSLGNVEGGGSFRSGED